jgi:hypothetical protein
MGKSWNGTEEDTELPKVVREKVRGEKVGLPAASWL